MVRVETLGVAHLCAHCQALAGWEEPALEEFVETVDEARARLTLEQLALWPPGQRVVGRMPTPRGSTTAGPAHQGDLPATASDAGVILLGHADGGPGVTLHSNLSYQRLRPPDRSTSRVRKCPGLLVKMAGEAQQCAYNE